MTRAGGPVAGCSCSSEGKVTLALRDPAVIGAVVADPGTIAAWRLVFPVSCRGGRAVHGALLVKVGDAVKDRDRRCHLDNCRAEVAVLDLELGEPGAVALEVRLCHPLIKPDSVRLLELFHGEDRKPEQSTLKGTSYTG